jgi:hypothetical protein
MQETTNLLTTANGIPAESVAAPQTRSQDIPPEAPGHPAASDPPGRPAAAPVARQPQRIRIEALSFCCSRFLFWGRQGLSGPAALRAIACCSMLR